MTFLVKNVSLKIGVIPINDNLLKWSIFREPYKREIKKIQKFLESIHKNRLKSMAKSGDMWLLNEQDIKDMPK